MVGTDRARDRGSRWDRGSRLRDRGSWIADRALRLYDSSGLKKGRFVKPREEEGQKSEAV